MKLGKKEGWKKGGVKRVLLIIFVFVVLVFILTLTTGLTHSLYHWATKKLHSGQIHSKSNADNVTKVIVLQKEPLHVGSNDKPNYPAQKEAGLIEYKYEVFFDRKPQKVTISVEVFDVDTIGGEILFNGNRIGSFSVGDLWHKDTFTVEGKYLKKGRNTVTVKTNILRTGKMEDFLFRNLKLFVEY